MTTLATALRQAQSQGLDRLDAQLLLLHALGRPPHDRAWLLAHDSDEVPAETLAAFAAAVERRLDGEPAAYITGHKEFFGLDLRVDRRVLVPRPDTETLVEWALELLPSAGSVIDLGTGSGAIALALKQMRPNAHVTAVDASVEALAVARANAQQLGLVIEFMQGDWLEGPQGTYDLIVSNPPYIAEDDTHLAALRHEPRQALTAGIDGLDDIRRIVAQARVHLHPGGWLLLEHGWDQAPAVRGLLAQAGLKDAQSRTDLAGIERCSGARAPQTGR